MSATLETLKERYFKYHLSNTVHRVLLLDAPNSLSVTCLLFVGTLGANERTDIPTQDFDFEFCILSFFGPFFNK